jgi:hypothetical protein
LHVVHGQAERGLEIAFGLPEDLHNAVPALAIRDVHVNHCALQAPLDAVEFADVPKQISQAADVVHVAVADEDGLHGKEVEAQQMSRPRTIFTGVEPVQGAID